MIDSSRIQYWASPTQEQIGQTVQVFLKNMGAPTLIHLSGRQSNRCRFISTLLHGNEPSGVRAFHRWLQQETVPEVDIYCFIGAVQTALIDPLFSCRHRPQDRDLNRCFKPPFDDDQGKLAEAFLQILDQKKPEALIDIHNTSGMGPAFSVASKQDAAHEALTSLFTERMLITDLKLGALFEYSERNVPTVTIECGGSQDPRSDDIAYEGLLRYTREDSVLQPIETDWPLEVLHHPVRLELQDGAEIRYRDHRDPLADLTLPPDVEHYNFGEVTPDTLLGWINPESWHKLLVRAPDGTDIKQQLLQIKGDGLYPADKLKLFMITTNPSIAKSDCVFYAVKS